MLLMTSNGLTSRRLRKAAKKALPAGCEAGGVGHHRVSRL